MEISGCFCRAPAETNPPSPRQQKSTQVKKIAQSSPDNHAHKYNLVEAERARIQRPLCDSAIAGAIAQEFTQDAALACEFAGEFYKEIGDKEKMMAYTKDAIGHYVKWGAFARRQHVKEKFGIQ